MKRKNMPGCNCCCPCLTIDELPVVTIDGLVGGGWNHEFGGACCAYQVFSPEVQEVQSTWCSTSLLRLQKTISRTFEAWGVKGTKPHEGTTPTIEMCCRGWGDCEPSVLYNGTTTKYYDRNCYAVVGWYKPTYILKVSRINIACEGEDPICKIMFALQKYFPYASDYRSKYYFRDTLVVSAVDDCYSVLATDPDCVSPAVSGCGHDYEDTCVYNSDGSILSGVCISDECTSVTTAFSELGTPNLVFCRVKFFDEMPSAEDLDFEDSDVGYPGCEYETADPFHNCVPCENDTNEQCLEFDACPIDIGQSETDDPFGFCYDAHWEFCTLTYHCGGVGAGEQWPDEACVGDVSMYTYFDGCEEPPLFTISHGNAGFECGSFDYTGVLDTVQYGVTCGPGSFDECQGAGCFQQSSADECHWLDSCGNLVGTLGETLFVFAAYNITDFTYSVDCSETHTDEVCISVADETWTIHVA